MRLVGLGLLALAGSFVSGCGSRSAFDQSELRISTGGLGNSAVSRGGASASATTQLADSGGVSATGGIGSSGGTTTAATGTDAGPPIWRNSRTPFCTTQRQDPQSGVAANLYSDSRGVFLQVLEQQDDIYFNDGGGWVSIFGEALEATGIRRLTGFQDGALVQSGAKPCGIQFIRDSVETCSAAQEAWFVYVVGSTSAYATSNDRILHCDGVTWTQFGDPLASGNSNTVGTRALWAAHDVVLVVASGGLVYVYPNADPSLPTRQLGLPSSNYAAAWGFGANDLWVGNSNGQLLHNNGNGWATAWSGTGNCSAIQQLWGANGAVYFITGDTFGVWRSGVATLIAQHPCDGKTQFLSLWGNSDSEVFVAYSDASRANDTCGNVVVMWFDGKTLSLL